ncbi:ferredoxin [Nocardia harenae]|uniref:ferredoxin n=1 Tax=Nocardia harenae TaxID=358707 RepID=UPI0008317FE6|nr:ferredoxin [Nocardia harenae]
MKVHVDTNKCSGHALCAANSPEVFDLDDLGYAVTVDGDVPAEQQRAARLGAESCPERAIAIED